MNALPSRRALMTGAAAMPLAVAAPALPIDPAPELVRLGELVVLACRIRNDTRRTYKSAQGCVARWCKRNPVPDCSQGGGELLAWLNRCASAIASSDMQAKYASYQAAEVAHVTAVAALLAAPVETRADLRALSRFGVYDHAGGIRAALVAHVEDGRGLA